MDKFSSMDNDFLNKVHQIVDENLGNELFTVDELSERIGISRSMLHRKLKRLTAKSATEIITEKRLSYAKKMIDNNVGTIAEIAYKVGFNSPSYFNKVFKKHYQVSPGNLRKEKKISTADHSTEERLAGRSKIILIVIPIILFVAALSWAGIHFMNSKTDRSQISIAILPFDNLGSNDDTQFFADGMVEDLLTRLSRLDDVKVISRTSSEMFRNKGYKTIPEIGKLLNVGYILEGTVQREKENLRISIQLIDANHDDHILSRQYDRRLDELFKVQREIAREIASEITPVLTAEQKEKLNKDHTQNSKAFEFYQLGRFHSSKRTAEGYVTGIKYYEEAIALDSNYALAYSGLADNYYLMALQGHMDRPDGRQKALKFADKALKIDPNLAEAHAVKGSLYTYLDSKWEEGEKYLFKAIELNPNYSTAQQYYSEYLKIMGRCDEARKHINKALELDPYSFVIRYQSSRFYYDNEQFDEAFNEIKICLDLEEEHPWAVSLEFDIFLGLGDTLAAIELQKTVVEKTGYATPEQIDSIYQTGGLDALTRWHLQLWDAIDKHQAAIFYAMIGDYEKAMDLLELKWKSGIFFPAQTTYREYKPLRSNPRFIAIRKKMGLPPLDQ